MGVAKGGDDAELLENLEEDLERMIVGVPVTHLNDISLCMQRHTLGVRSRFSCLLKKVT